MTSTQGKAIIGLMVIGMSACTSNQSPSMGKNFNSANDLKADSHAWIDLYNNLSDFRNLTPLLRNAVKLACGKEGKIFNQKRAPQSTSPSSSVSAQNTLDSTLLAASGQPIENINLKNSLPTTPNKSQQIILDLKKLSNISKARCQTEDEIIYARAKERYLTLSRSSIPLKKAF